MNAVASDGTIWGTIAAGLLVVLGILYRGFSKIRRDTQVDGTESETLRALNAAVKHWQELYDVAWKQVAKERELREVAEARVAHTIDEVEMLRAEVASLRREIERLTALVSPDATADG